ncbi:MAG: hypothetical protein GX491_00300 [Chloroflexi bacterium]|nr:hypothetical protein [Chloroflexota bacterium]
MGLWLRRVFGRSAAEPAGPARLPDPVTVRVSLVIYDPRVNGQKLTRALGWNDPDRLAAALIDDLREVSHGYANYQVAERIEIDAFPVKKDGFQYTAEDYLSRIRAGQGFHQPDAVDYERVLAESSLVEKINSGAIDEVWTISFPWAGFYESRMAGPGAFWCNAPPLEGTGANRRFVIMAFNYERGVGEMLESYGHRAESILGHVFRNIPEPDNLWKRFTRHEKTHPGQAEVGNIHFAPNSRRDYDWGNNTPVLTRFNAWRNFPDLSGEPVRAESRAWGQGDIREHHRWWFSLLPHVAGSSNGISHNWWEYIVDPNRVQ